MQFLSQRILSIYMNTECKPSGLAFQGVKPMVKVVLNSLGVLFLLNAIACDKSNPTEPKTPLTDPDNTPPYVESITGFSPGMAPNTPVIVDFSEPVDTESLEISLKNLSTGESFSISDYTVSDDTLSFRGAVALVSGHGLRPVPYSRTDVAPVR